MSRQGFQKGVSGNPKGRPKGTTKSEGFSAILRDYLGSTHPNAKSISVKLGQKIRTRLDMVLIRLEKEDPKILLYYAYGKPIETQVHQNPDGTSLAPIGIHITGGIIPQRNASQNKTGE